MPSAAPQQGASAYGAGAALSVALALAMYYMTLGDHAETRGRARCLCAG